MQLRQDRVVISAHTDHTEHDAEDQLSAGCGQGVRVGTGTPSLRTPVAIIKRRPTYEMYIFTTSLLQKGRGLPVVELIGGEAEDRAEAQRAEKRVQVYNILLVVLELAPDLDSALFMFVC